MNGNLEYYKVFYYVEKMGSITAASEALCISQPAVSQAVKQLERSLGTILFIRTAKGVRLTEEGRTLHPTWSGGWRTSSRGRRPWSA